MQFKTIFHEFAHRIQQETPPFFKKVRAFGLWIAGIGGAFKSTQAITAKLPDVLAHICAQGVELVGIGAVIAIVASAACQQPLPLPTTPEE